MTPFGLLVVAILVLAGMSYKIAAVPFHFLCPDVYEGAPKPVSAIFSVGPKAAGFALMIRFFYVVAINNHLKSEEPARLHRPGVRAPWAGAMMVIFLGSLTGIPPFAGFVGKFYLFTAAMDKSMFWLVIVAALNSVVGLYYYFKVAKAMFLVQPPEDADTSPIKLHWLQYTVLAVLAVPTLALRNSSSGQSTQFLFANREGAGSGRVLVDETAAAGFSSTAKSFGLAVADYNGDGFSDIYFSRASSDPFFFKAKPSPGHVQNKWLGVKLKSYNGLNCSNGLGAEVFVTANSQVRTQVVDGGSGLASQRESDLVFGLGGYSGEVTIEVVWPNGYTQTDTAEFLSQYLTIEDEVPVVKNLSVQFSRIHHISTGLDDWIFTWETAGEGKTDLDKVTLDLASVSQQCHPGHSILTNAISSVTTTIAPLGHGKYQHTLTYKGIDCVARCTIPFTVESAQPGYISTSGPKTLSIKSCLVTP